ncbi:MAG: type II toxin-antitoxin system RatA family toxin [Brachymonas sp.]|nr:type II toxin-antitoxin system RatA family toxin [Brachymonas sp.]
MKSVRKSVVVPYSPAEMFELVSNVSAYPQFLPWCSFARVVETLPDGKVAEVGIGMGGLRQSFTTRNTEQPGQQIDIRLVRGPFSDLHGQWRFDAVGDGSTRACRITLDLRYRFSGFLLARLIGPVFDQIAVTFVDAFTQRAQQVYGKF